jgi:ClpP class serine protease
VGLGLLAGFAVARGRRSRVAEVQVALEQVLDRLERGEITLPPKTPGGGATAIERIATEIRKNLGL